MRLLASAAFALIEVAASRSAAYLLLALTLIILILAEPACCKPWAACTHCKVTL